jgi:hypothetical protein
MSLAEEQIVLLAECELVLRILYFAGNPESAR